VVAAYNKVEVLYEVVEYVDEEDSTSKRNAFNKEVLECERRIRGEGSYYALAFFSGPCSLCEERKCCEERCRRFAAARMPICASTIDLKHLSTEVLGLSTDHALSFWKSNLTQHYFRDHSPEHLCIGLVLY